MADDSAGTDKESTHHSRPAIVHLVFEVVYLQVADDDGAGGEGVPLQLVVR